MLRVVITCNNSAWVNGMSTWTTTGAAQPHTLPWAQVDVFAEARFQGNPLAIFTDATGLTTDEMQALARETNLSETTFILPGSAEEEREHGVRVRIFTVQEELPFAGHPTLGTASWLWANHPHLRGANEVRLRLNSGTVPVRFRPPAPGEQGVFGEMTQADPMFGPLLDRDAIAAACGLAATDLHISLRPQVVSTGLQFCVLPLASPDALGHMRMDHVALSNVLADTGAKFVYAVARMGDHTWRARMTFYGGDDPATGSAAGCCISYLVRHGAVASAAPCIIQQGAEVLRPSRIHVQATLQQGSVTQVLVGGRTIPVASGGFAHP